MAAILHAREMLKKFSLRKVHCALVFYSLLQKCSKSSQFSLKNETLI